MEPYASSSSTENAEPATENEQQPEVKPKNNTKRARQDCGVSESTSHTMFLKKERYEDLYSRITRDEYFGKEESLSASSDSFHCVHGPEGKQYTEQGRLKRNIIKNLDRVPLDRKWNDDCPPAYDWDVAKKLMFLIMDSAELQLERMNAHLRDFARTTREGFRVDVLDTTCVILDFLVKTYEKEPSLREGLVMLLNNMAKPILLNVFNDIVTYFESLRNYLGFMGYLLLWLEPDGLFDLVAKALLWQLSAPDAARGPGTVPRRRALLAAAPPLYQTIARMLALATSHRFPTFLQTALLLACDSANNCIELLKENILENIMYRFNPYFPERALPAFDINPADPQDYRVKLGDSGEHLSTTVTLFLVLLTNLKKFTDNDPEFTHTLPCPDSYALRCFTWAYRYECRAREHKQERITLTVVAWVLVKCFGRRLQAFSTLLMPDVMSLSVLTELPHKTGWIKDVGFNRSLVDVQFKKILIYFCIDLLKTFPYNKHMAESQYWVLGLMYLLDPALSSLRARWASSLVAELRKMALQALVCSLPLLPPHIAKDYSLIRRIMWYIEWYSESPYELPVLYWCVRLLQVACQRRRSPERPDIISDLFDTHGIIILMQLCLTLMDQEKLPVEKRQAIIALSLRMLTSALEARAHAACCVYPAVKWPRSINSLADKMLDNILKSLHSSYIISDRWMISLLNFIWEAIIWNEKNRKNFISQNGVYRLLDLITMARPPVQCLALALVCDIARAGDAVGQLVTWRACAGASEAYPMVVKRGSTIASLLASVFRDGCRENGIELDENGIIQDMDIPLKAADIKKAMSCSGFPIGRHTQTPVCYAASDLAGSRMSKAFALLQLLSEDLNFKVNLADEAYKLYKHIQLEAQDEAILVLCSHYLTQKLNEAWCEIETQYPDVEPFDKYTVQEFRHISKGWAVEIKRQQLDVIETDRKKNHDEEYSLYAFLGRVRLNTALDALREVRCTARSADRARLTHALLSDAVRAHQQRAAHAHRLGAPVLRTYGPSLDDQNITGQYVKVCSIKQKTETQVPQPVDCRSSP